MILYVLLIEKLDKEDRTGTQQNKAVGTDSILKRFSKLRAELEDLRKQQGSIVCNGKYISGMLQYSQALLNQAEKEVEGEASTNIIERIQLPPSPTFK